MKKTYKIEVDCANCARKMEEATKKVEGVADATVSFMTQKMNVEFAEDADIKAVMSNVYFRSLFKAQYHLSPSQYIISVRLKNAKSLMKYSFLTLEECALQSGFSSLQYFCRVFKKYTGMTPSEYRKQ